MIGSSLAKPFSIYRSSHGYMHMRIQLTPSGHYILGFNPSLHLKLEFVILINNLLICRTVQSTLRVNCRYGLCAFHPHPISQCNVNEPHWGQYEHLSWTGVFQVNYYTVNRLPIKGAEHVSLKAPLCEQLLWVGNHLAAQWANSWWPIGEPFDHSAAISCCCSCYQWHQLLQLSL